MCLGSQTTTTLTFAYLLPRSSRSAVAYLLFPVMVCHCPSRLQSSTSSPIILSDFLNYTHISRDVFICASRARGTAKVSTRHGADRQLSLPKELIQKLCHLLACHMKHCSQHSSNGAAAATAALSVEPRCDFSSRLSQVAAHTRQMQGSQRRSFILRRCSRVIGHRPLPARVAALCLRLSLERGSVPAFIIPHWLRSC